MKILDLCAGPGGWDLAAQALGLDVLGVEWDDAACLTRKAAGLATIQGDIREQRHLIPTLGHWALIASPPCQTFSAAGNGSGRKDLDAVLLGVELLALGLPLPTYADERTGLVLEPLAWVLHAAEEGNLPRWIALEQVPAVLPVWEAYAVVLRGIGHSVACGILHAEQYGVPQTRRRAVLLASLDREARLPTPTHSRYYSRNPEKLDEGVLPWVSMAEALGQARTLTHWRGSGMIERYGDRPDRKPDQPAFTVAGGGSGSGMLRWDTPAPSVNGDARLAPRGCKHPGPGPGCCSAYPGTPGRQFGPGTLRVTVEEAAALQTFPDGYPWQGTKTQQHQQVGNAIPPLLARAILSAVLS